MDIKNTISYIGDGVKVASVKNAAKLEQPIPAGQNPDVESVDKISDKLETSALKVQNKAFEKAIADVNQFFQAERRTLSFSVNEATKDVIIEVKDAETNEVIRQIPPEFVLKLAEHLTELSTESGDSAGLLLKDKA